MADEISLEDYKKAHREVIIQYERKVFKIHLTAYLVINGALLAANLLFTPGKYWVVWPILGWGIGVVSHYIKAIHRIEGELIRKEAQAEERAGK
jgi:hypothetical protein